MSSGIVTLYLPQNLYILGLDMNGCHGRTSAVLILLFPAQLEDLWELVLEGINNGEVIPLPVTSFARTEAEEAFRYMAQGELSYQMRPDDTFTLF